MLSPRPFVEGIILIAALLANAAVLYFLTNPGTRLGLGLLLLAPIVWASARLGVVELMTRLPSDRVHKRRFVKLRAQVKQLLEEIRRLNWMAVDADRGFRNREIALREMDNIERRLQEIIQQIRSTAGQKVSDRGAGGAGGFGSSGAG